MKIDWTEAGRKARIASLTFFGAVIAFWAWWFFAANYDYSMLAGTYVFRGQGVTSRLMLHSDRTFHQEVTQDGHTRTASGTWHRSGEAGVSFSIEFLRVPGGKTFVEEFGKGYGSIEDNVFFGHFEKILGVYPILKINNINADPPGPTFHKVWFS